MSGWDELLSEPSLSSIAFGLGLALLLAVEAGYRLHSHWRSREVAAAAQTFQGGTHILSAALGLLALILGFSFSMALGRYDVRRHLVLEESNAIGTVYLRAQILQEPARSEMSALIGEYVGVRLEYFAASNDRTRQEQTWARTGEVQRRLWAALTVQVQPLLTSELSSLLLESANAAFDIAAARHAAFGSHIPASVLAMVMAYAFISMGLLGYVLFDSGRRHFMTSTLLIVLLTMVITLILDIDRPRRGTVTVSVAPLVELQREIAGQR